MNITADDIVSMLRSRGQHGRADAAQAELPAQVNPNDAGHQDLLATFGIDPADLLSKFGGLGHLGRML